MFISRMIDTDYFTEILVFLFYCDKVKLLFCLLGSQSGIYINVQHCHQPEKILLKCHCQKIITFYVIILCHNFFYIFNIVIKSIFSG